MIEENNKLGKELSPKVSNTKRHFINFCAVLVVFLFIYILVEKQIISSYIQGILISTFISIIMATSLNIATGFLGQIALGNAGFMAIGAYSSAIITIAMKNANILSGGPFEDLVRFLIGTTFGGILAGCFGLLVGIPALRLKGDYLAIITLGFGEIIRVMIQNMDITRKGRSFVGMDSLSNLYVIFWIMVISVSILYAFVNSKYGRAIVAIREDEIAAGASGLNTTYYKVLAFTLSAFFAGVAGSIYAHYVGTLQPNLASFNKSIEFVVIVVLGGMGSLTGSVVAAIILVSLPEALRSFSQYRMIIYSVTLIIMMIFRPSGLFGNYEFSLIKILNRYRKKEKHISLDKMEVDS
ncbi:branched-chain amino acid ABC transporter permease [Fusobacterium sp. PH5-44]|uniref:branched-chain amino acid ABC transporter permease n=1 Tax=unclassified Fusobacterium TaxID=2648384 RepID=UPI003D19A7B1